MKIPFALVVASTALACASSESHPPTEQAPAVEPARVTPAPAPNVEPVIEAPAPTPTPPAKAAPAPTAVRELSAFEREARARAAFAALTQEKKQQVVDWLATDTPRITCFRTTLMRFVLDLEGSDPGLMSAAPSPTWFDPEQHAPKQPIPRRMLAPGDPLVQQARAQILGNVEPRELQSAWVYDYATREVYALPDVGDPDRVFHNALLGQPPNWDFVEALVELELDDGSLQQSFEAFGNAYTDRVGGVYPEITLYDAWASRTEIEMPDVDNLGIVHHVLDDWETWKSVVPADQLDALYARIAGLFSDALHYRGLRHALARTYLCGTTELRDGYQQHIDRFQALWESAHSDPRALAPVLPAPENWAEFLQAWSDQLDGDETALLKGIRRRYTLDGDGHRVRTLLYWILEQVGA